MPTYEFQSEIVVILSFCLLIQIIGIYWIFSKKRNLQNGKEDSMISDNFEELPMMSISIGFISGITLISFSLYLICPKVLTEKIEDSSIVLILAMFYMYIVGVGFMVGVSKSIFKYFCKKYFPKTKVNWLFQ